jgi:hypothetical protein
MRRLGDAKAQGSVTIPGTLILAIVTALLITALVLVKLMF